MSKRKKFRLLELYTSDVIFGGMSVTIKNAVRVYDDTEFGNRFSIPAIESLCATIALWRITHPERLSKKEARSVFLSSILVDEVYEKMDCVFGKMSFPDTWKECASSESHERLFRMIVAFVLTPHVPILPEVSASLVTMRFVERRKDSFHIEAETVPFLAKGGINLAWYVRVCEK